MRNTHREPRAKRSLRIPLTAVAFLLGFALVVSAASTPTANSLTVGEFAMLVASRVHDSGASLLISTPDEAVASLRTRGIRIQGDLSSPATEKDAVDLFGQFGISLQAHSPDNLLNPERAASLVGIFGSSLASFGSQFESSPLPKESGSPVAKLTADSTEPWWPFPSDPEECRYLWPDHSCTGQVCGNPCMYCCSRQLDLDGNTCGHLCQKKNLIVSPTEPAP